MKFCGRKIIRSKTFLRRLGESKLLTFSSKRRNWFVRAVERLPKDYYSFKTKTEGSNQNGLHNHGLRYMQGDRAGGRRSISMVFTVRKASPRAHPDRKPILQSQIRWKCEKLFIQNGVFPNSIQSLSIAFATKLNHDNLNALECIIAFVDYIWFCLFSLSIPEERSISERNISST